MRKFYRIISLVLLIALNCTIFVSTANAEIDSNNRNSTNVFRPQVTSVESKFPRVPDENYEIEGYLDEVQTRLIEMMKSGSFLTANEWNFLEDYGFNVLDNGMMLHDYDERYGYLTRYEYPLVFKGLNGVELWYLTNTGELRSEAITGKVGNGYSSQSYGQVHHEKTIYDEVLVSCTYYSVMYNASTGRVSVWEFGDMVREYYVPENSIYAGLSHNEGYIFRSGTDVYAVRDYGCYFTENEVCVIAHNVQFVIDTDYEADGSDEWSQPLFLMTDGTVKCYCPWFCEEGTPVDDEYNLIDVRFEGGFNI